jgi:hypothetical protein
MLIPFCVTPQVFVHLGRGRRGGGHNSAELSYSGLLNTAIPHKQQQQRFEYCRFVCCREVSDLSMGFEDCMLGTAILETRRFVFVATKWTRSSSYSGSFLVHSPQRRGYVYRDTMSCWELIRAYVNAFCNH